MSDVAKGIRECLDTINKLREENAAQAAEIARLRAELATARREGMEEAAKIADECALEAAAWQRDVSNERGVISLMESRARTLENAAAAIRAALTGGKDE